LNFIVIKESNGGGLLVNYQPWLVAAKRNCVASQVRPFHRHLNVCIHSLDARS
jgi:hypothetical protein